MIPETINLPELGERVTLREGTVGDILPLAAAAGDLSTADLMVKVLAASLWTGDGDSASRVTERQIRALPARRFRELMKLGPRALALNGFIDPDAEAEAEASKAEEPVAPKI